MYRPARKLVRATFGALVVGSLGFGVSEALATPATASEAAQLCTGSQIVSCNEACAPLRGRCTIAGGQAACECF